MLIKRISLMCFKFQTVPFCFLSCAPKKLHIGMIWDESFGPVGLLRPLVEFFEDLAVYIYPMLSLDETADTMPFKLPEKMIQKTPQTLRAPNTTYRKFSVSLRCVLGTTRDDPRVMIPQVAEWTTNHAEASESWKVWNIKSPQLWHLPKTTSKTKIQCLESKWHNPWRLYTTESDGISRWIPPDDLRGFTARWSSAFTTGLYSLRFVGC